MLRSVGAGGGQPPSATRWAASDGCPYRDRQLRSETELVSIF